MGVNRRDIAYHRLLSFGPDAAVVEEGRLDDKPIEVIIAPNLQNLESSDRDRLSEEGVLR